MFERLIVDHVAGRRKRRVVLHIDGQRQAVALDVEQHRVDQYTGWAIAFDDSEITIRQRKLWRCGCHSGCCASCTGRHETFRRAGPRNRTAGRFAIEMLFHVLAGGEQTVERNTGT